MRYPTKTAVAALLAALVVTGPQTHSVAGDEMPIRPELADLLAAASGPMVVLVGGDTTSAALRAVEAAGLTALESFDRFGIVAAAGLPAAVRALHRQPGVRRIDADQALEPLDDLAHRATGVAALRSPADYSTMNDLRRADGTPFDGTGVSIAVIDGGFDGTHEQFTNGGASKLDVHLRQACPMPREWILYAAGTDPSPDCSAWLPVDSGDDEYDEGHGTIVAATAAGYARTTPAGTPVSGVAPGARLVGLSLGAGGAMVNAFSAFNWVLEHHTDPCGNRSCPAIRVVNASWGLAADDESFQRRFDPTHPISLATTALVSEGVVVVFAAGNSGGDGTRATTNVFGLNPVPGFLLVGSYFDGNAGDRDLMVSSFSSRGEIGDGGTYPDLLAPGEAIMIGCAHATVGCSTSPGLDGDYGSFSGTSLSAPHISGVVAQLLEANPLLTPAQVEDTLEDTAHRLGPPGRFEPDVYTDFAGIVRGNSDHPTSFDAGHGNVDVVGALSLALSKAPRTAPDTCPHASSVEITDPAGDARILYQPSPVEQPDLDVVRVTASLDAEPGALTVVVRYRDLPEVASTPMHTSVLVSIDRGGNLPPSTGTWSADAEIVLDRNPAGATFGDYRGLYHVTGTIDPVADTATFVVHPPGGSVQNRAGVSWVWTSTRDNAFIADADLTGGGCTIWVSGT